MLFVMWAVVLMAGLLVYGIWRRKRIIRSYVNETLQETLMPGFSLKKRWIKAGLYIAALVFTVTALSGPLAGYKWVQTHEKGVDIMVALDCSRSMLAQDIKPSRLERAKREIIDLLRMLESDRVGLVAFAGQAILQCPLTLDHEAFNIFLRVLDPEYLPVGGTDLVSAINTCLNAFEADSDTEKAIILITDGEDTVSDPGKAAQAAAEKGVKIFCIGVGNPQGAPIPDKTGGFKKDEAGNIVLSKVDEKVLEKISGLTNGQYERSVAGDMDLESIYYTHIKKTMDQKTLKTSKKKVWENRFQWFLFPAILLLLLEFALSARTGKRKIPITGLIVFSMVLSISDVSHAFVFSSVRDGIKAYEANQFDQAKTHFIDAQLEDPDRPELYFNIGTAAYKNQEFELAEKHFLKAMTTEDKELRHQSEYNLANTRYRLGNLDEAIKGYESILKEFPEDSRAKENLEFVQKKKEEQKQNQEQDQNSKDNQEKPSKNQDKDKMDSKDPGTDSKSKDSDQNKENKPDSQNSQKKDEKERSPDNGSDTQPSPDNQAQKEMNQPQEDKASGSQEQQPAGENGEDPGEKGSPVNMNENMLNRLQDKPGQALMPVYAPKNIKKDW